VSDKIFATCSTKAGICGSTGCVTPIGGAQHGVVCTDASFIASINCPVHGEAAKCSTITTGSTPSFSATCTGASYTGALISAASSTTCARSTCATTDTNCCELIAKCDSITTSFAEINDICSEPDYKGANGDPDSFLIADAATTDCGGGSCSSSDSAACCIASFAKCDTITTDSDPNLGEVCTGGSYSGSLISTASSTNCATNACGTTDASSCCAALCSTITSTSVPSLATICSGSSFSYTENLIAGKSCTGLICSTSDKATCCEVNARCNTITTGSTPSLSTVCGGGGSYTGALIDAATTTNCAGLACANLDKATCCAVKAKCITLTTDSDPTLAATCTTTGTSYNGALIGASATTECAGVACATSDASSCCAVKAKCNTLTGASTPTLAATCTGASYTGALIGAAATTDCADVACAELDASVCCVRNPAAKCDTVTISSNPTLTDTCTGVMYTGALIGASAATGCAEVACALSDASVCCERNPAAKCNTLTGASTPTLAATCTGASYTGALIGAAATTDCAGLACAISDKATCCEVKALCDTITTGSTPTLAETCTSASGSTGALIGAATSTYCAGTTCATSDTNCCVQSSGDQGGEGQGGEGQGGQGQGGQGQGGQGQGGFGGRRLNSKTGTGRRTSETNVISVEISQPINKRRRSLLQIDGNTMMGGGNTDVDCIGAYHSCESDCTKTYDITTAATGEGKACAFVKGDKAVCTLDESTLDACTGISCVGSIGICSQNCYKKYSVSTEKSGDGTECQFGGKKIEHNEKVLCTYSESTSDACVDPNDPDGVIAPVISQTVVPGKETTILNNC